MGVFFAAKLRRGSTRTCSAAWSRCARWQCVCVPSPSTGSGHRKCGNATGRGRRCTDATRGFSGRLWDWAFSNPVKRTATTTAAAPTTTAATGLAPEPVTASEKSQKAAPSQNRRDRGWSDACGASIRITAAGPATAAIMYHAGVPSRGPVSEFGTTVQPLSRRQTIATFEMGRSSPRIDWSTNSEKSACRSGAGHT